MEPDKNVPDVSHLCFARMDREHCEHYEEDGHCCDCKMWAPEMCEKGCGQRKDSHMDFYCTSFYPRGEPVFDLLVHIKNQQRFSFKTFGPPGEGQKSEGVIDHLEKELAELRKKPTDLLEWIDVVLLGIDGASKAGYSPKEIVEALMAKQVKNENRKWPDWRTADLTKAIEHVRTEEEIQVKSAQIPLNFDGNGSPVS